MAKHFWIAIPFNEKEHTAVLNIRPQGCDLLCSVHFTDNQLHFILSGKQLAFGLMEGLKVPARLPGKRAETLVKHTLNAITTHLQTSELELS